MSSIWAVRLSRKIVLSSVVASFVKCDLNTALPKQGLIMCRTHPYNSLMSKFCEDLWENIVRAAQAKFLARSVRVCMVCSNLVTFSGSQTD